MAAPILSALASGFTNKQIIQYLLRTFPAYAPQINKALKYGFSPDRIVKYLAKGREGVNDSGEMTEVAATRKTDKENESKLEKIIGGTGLAIAGLGIGAGLYDSGAIQGIQGLMGGTQNAPQPGNQPPPPPVAPSPPPLPNATTPINPQTIANPGGNMQPAMPVSAGTQLAAQQMQQQVPNGSSQPPQLTSSQNISSPSDVLWDAFTKGKDKASDPETSMFLKIARNIRQTGGLNSKEQFEKFHQIFENKRHFGMSVPELAREMFSSYDHSIASSPDERRNNAEQNIGKTAQQPTQDQKVMEPSGQKLDVNPQETQAPVQKEDLTPEVKSARVAVLPNGDLASIKSIKGKVVKLDVDGKHKIMNLSRIIESPLPSKGLADLHDDLIEGIEAATDEPVSRMVDWAGYDPKTNKLSFLPHDGAMYTYDDISEEDKDLLRNVLNVRKTSGENFIGAWKAGSNSPIGAAMSKLIQKLQKERGGKGNEYSGKYETIYSSKEPAVKASKAKKRALELKAREEKKKAKDEERKKRKK